MEFNYCGLDSSDLGYGQFSGSCELTGFHNTLINCGVSVKIPASPGELRFTNSTGYLDIGLRGHSPSNCKCFGQFVRGNRANYFSVFNSADIPTRIQHAFLACSIPHTNHSQRTLLSVTVVGMLEGWCQSRVSRYALL